MTLFQDTGGDPRAARSVVSDVLAWYGAIGDAAVGNPSGFALRKASIAVSLARSCGVANGELHALYFAGMLHAIGAIGNRAYRKDEHLSERIARMESWDVPAAGARVCALIVALPPETPDLVRWQAESWDGTGYPDQLRWHGIPKNAQFLHLADRYARASDPDEALAAIALDSGRSFGPEHVRAFSTWFHVHRGEVELLDPPVDALREAGADPSALFDVFADRIDDHIGMPGRWRRIDALAAGTATALALDERAVRTLALACRMHGAGEISHDGGDDEAFDPLARLGVELRAREAATAATLGAPFATLRDAAAAVAARGEWYDGSGKPAGRSRDAIPVESRILAAAIAYDRLDKKERLDTAAGLQFDPAIVRALMSVKSRI